MGRTIPAPFYRGKVRDLYDAGDTMILVASDRISAFDVVFEEPITGKGKILTSISTRWFKHFRNGSTISQSDDHRPLEQILDFEDHLITDQIEEFPEPYRNYEPFRNRAILVRRTQRIDFECVVRGYLAGSAWKDYQRTGAVCGHALPSGMKQSEKLPEPIFTPATKEDSGRHDENVTREFMRDRIGPELTDRLEKISIALFLEASARLEKVGILLCDTKFEFGLLNGRIVLIDEVLTPDSSRFWDQSFYRPGETVAGFDKQYIRDYLESTGWNKTPPAPPLPAWVIEKTIGLYREMESRIERAI
jgi:phosphoribosylaminoimidazole-succinocarboxamide synthase